MKERLIRLLSPLRRVWSKIYIFFIASYLGQILIVLNQIDDLNLDWIFYFFVYNPVGKTQIEEFHVFMKNTMGKKLSWLQSLAEGEKKLPPESEILKISPSSEIIKTGKAIKQMIAILKPLINDTRNPLVHSRYYLGYGNESQWALSYSRSHGLNRENFSIKSARGYLKSIKKEHSKLNKLFAAALEERFPLNSPPGTSV